MPEIGTDLQDIVYTAPTSRVYVADAAREADFVEVPFLYCVLLRVVAAPEVDQCELVFDYGTMMRAGETSFSAVAKQSLTSKYVKVVIEDTETGTYTRDIVWYGRIAIDEREVFGSLGAVPTGSQRIVATGLLGELDQDVIRDSRVILYDETSTKTIRRGLPFNYDQGGAFVRRGNRSLLKPADANAADDPYVFTNEPRSLIEWNALDAVKYLLRFHAPKDSTGADANKWQLATDTVAGNLDWYDVSIETDGRTVKQVLDQLINRHRAVGYYVYFDPNESGAPADRDRVILKVFTFNDAVITLPGGSTLEPNPDTYSLNFEQALDIESCIVSQTELSRFHTVIARGARITSTFTYRLLDKAAQSALYPDWTSAELTEHLAGASSAVDYASLDLDEKGRRNYLYRSEDRLRNVFSRFKFNWETWDQRVPVWHDGPANEYHFAPVVSTSDVAIDPLYHAVDNPSGEPVWLGGVRILRHLPLMDRYDYAGDVIQYTSYDAGFTDAEHPDFIPPFAYTRTAIYPEEWEYLEKLNVRSEDAGGRKWAAALHVVDAEPALELRAHPPQMLGLQEWNGETPAETLPEHDPIVSGGIQWVDVYCTLCCELDQHIEAERVISPPATDAGTQVLMIPVPDARFDYVLPYTTVGIKDGQPSVTTSGGAVRDDRERLEDIARAAAEWYGRPRQTLDLRYRQCRGMFEIGWLITSIGANYSLTGINTVVTSITYTLNTPGSFGNQSTPATQVLTSYAELDVR
jgi:hypothetical protein